jgi:hypothetical protein
MSIFEITSTRMGNMKAIINQIENHRFKVFVFVSISTLMIYGIATGFYYVYNISFYSNLFNSGIFIDEHLPIVHRIDHYQYVLRWFYIIFRWPLQVPALFIVSSLIVKIIILWLIYKIADFLLDDSFLAFISSLYFVLAGNYNTHCLSLNGIQDSPVFINASISAILTLTGIYLALKERLITGALFLTFSFYLHVLYGVTALVFFLPGYLYYLIFKKNKDIRSLIIPGAIICLNLLFVVSGSGNLQNDLPFLQSTLSQWYTYIYSLDPEDMSLLYAFGNHGYALLLLIAIALHIAYNFKQTDSFSALRNLFFGGVLVLAVAFVIEFAHRYGFFMGKLSEFFIGVELRRGVWVLMFFSIMLILKQIDIYLINKETENGVSDLKRWVLVASFLSVYLLSDWLFVGFLSALFIILKATRKSAFLMLLFIFSMVPFFFWAELEITSRMLQIAAFYCVCACTFFFIYYWIGMERKILFLFPVMVFIICGVLAGSFQQKRKLSAGIKQISYNGFFSLPDYKFLGYAGKNDEKILEILRQNNPEHLPILRLTKSLDYNDIYIYGARSFISMREFRGGMFSKQLFENLLYKVKELGLINSSDEFHYKVKELGLISNFEGNFHPGSNRFYSKEAVRNFIDTGINNLDQKKLRYLNEKYNISFLLTETQYPDFKLLFEQDGTYLYALF